MLQTFKREKSKRLHSSRLILRSRSSTWTPNNSSKGCSPPSASERLRCSSSRWRLQAYCAPGTSTASRLCGWRSSSRTTPRSSSVFPEALVSMVDDIGIFRFLRRLPAENRFSTYAEIRLLLWDCVDAYRQHRFPASSTLRRTTRRACRCTYLATASRGTRCSRASSSRLLRLQSPSSSTRASVAILRLLLNPSTQRQRRCWRV